MNSDWQRRLIEMMEDNDVVWQRLYLIRKMVDNEFCDHHCKSCEVGGGRTTLTLLAFQVDYNMYGVPCWGCSKGDT